MNLLYIITHLNEGGAQRYVCHLATMFHAQGNSVTVGVGFTTSLSTQLQRSGITIHRFKFLRRTYNPIINILFSIEMYFFLRHNHYDVVHFNSSNPLFGVFSTWVTSRKRTKIVFTFHGLSLMDPGWKKSRYIALAYRWITTILIRCIDHYIFVCERDAVYAQENNLISKKRKFSIIYCEIPNDLGELDKNSARCRLEKIVQKKLSNTVIIGAIARLHYQKNIELLISVARTLNIPNVVFCILGRGPEKERLNSLIQTYDLSESCFILDVPEPRVYIRAFDMFVLSSRYEGIPLTVIEAMKNKLPIIATNVGGISEVLSHGESGIIVNSNTPEELSEAIHYLIKNSDDAKRLANNAFSVAKIKFLQGKMTTETYQLYQTLILELKHATSSRA